RTVSSNEPPFYGAVYAEPSGLRLMGRSQVSEENGRTWTPFTAKPDFMSGLTYGYRRETMTSACDPRTGRLLIIVNALDTPGLDPKAHEPPLAQQSYYLRYRVSENGGRTWLFDEPIIQNGRFDIKHPVA